MLKCSSCASPAACFLARTPRQDLEERYFVLDPALAPAQCASKVAWWREAITHVYEGRGVACLSGAELYAAFSQPEQPVRPDKAEFLAALELGLHGKALRKAGASCALGCQCAPEPAAAAAAAPADASSGGSAVEQVTSALSALALSPERAVRALMACFRGGGGGGGASGSEGGDSGDAPPEADATLWLHPQRASALLAGLQRAMREHHCTLLGGIGALLLEHPREAAAAAAAASAASAPLLSLPELAVRAALGAPWLRGTGAGAAFVPAQPPCLSDGALATLLPYATAQGLACARALGAGQTQTAVTLVAEEGAAARASLRHGSDAAQGALAELALDLQAARCACAEAAARREIAEAKRVFQARLQAAAAAAAARSGAAAALSDYDKAQVQLNTLRRLRAERAASLAAGQGARCAELKATLRQARGNKDQIAVMAGVRGELQRVQAALPSVEAIEELQADLAEAAGSIESVSAALMQGSVGDRAGVDAELQELMAAAAAARAGAATAAAAAVQLPAQAASPVQPQPQPQPQQQRSPPAAPRVLVPM